MSLRIGVIGCGNVSSTYLELAHLFPGLRYVACADRNPDAAAATGARFGIRACPSKELLCAEDIDLVLNLTVPAAHAEISMAAIEHGKHVYVEKPLATSVMEGRRIVEAASAKGLRVGCAPDTILGPGVQYARQLIEDGAIGKPITGSATALSHGMEHVHPNPEFFYQKGGGPVFDRAPYDIAALVTLLGPVTSVTASGRIGKSERIISAKNSARRGQKIIVEVLTTVQAMLTFENEAQINFMSSWDVCRSEAPLIEIHGSEGSVRVPDANWFGGNVQWSTSAFPCKTLQTDHAVAGKPNIVRVNGELAANYRGLGIAEMDMAIQQNRPHRLDGQFALHVLAVLEAIHRSAESSCSVTIDEHCPPMEALNDRQSADLFCL